MKSIALHGGGLALTLGEVVVSAVSPQSEEYAAETVGHLTGLGRANRKPESRRPRQSCLRKGRETAASAGRIGDRRRYRVGCH